MTGHADNPMLTALRNRCFMHLLERISLRFSEAGVPLMLLKGAALNLLVDGIRFRRPMSDLDLLVRPEDVVQARALLEELGCLRGQELVREDFFPRFHYEVEYSARGVYPMKIDLHVRPFRPLRYSRLVPDEALWARAREVRVGRGVALVPCPEDMLVHLAVHAAVHGFASTKWLDDIRQWTTRFYSQIDWDRFVATIESWRLTFPVRAALARAAQQEPLGVPQKVLDALGSVRIGWRDRLALWQAPRDAAHPVMHVLVNVLCTPGWRFALAYLKAVVVPDPAHMAEWYWRRHRGWLPCAHLLRWTWPLVGLFPRWWRRFSRIEVRSSRIHGLGVFATRNINAGAVIARCRGRVVDRKTLYVGWSEPHDGETRLFEFTGRLKHLNHSCNPNAQLLRSTLIAARLIRSGEEITISYGDGACQCNKSAEPAPASVPALRRAEVA